MLGMVIRQFTPSAMVASGMRNIFGVGPYTQNRGLGPETAMLPKSQNGGK